MNFKRLKVAYRGQIRPLQLERLEDKLPLAGDTFLINFQLSGSPIPNSYLTDTGELFGDRGLGMSYGWSSDHTDVSRDRESNPDQRFDTLVHFHQFQEWELQVPNGDYEVLVSIGDGQVASNHTLNVEGVSFWNDQPLAPGQFEVMTQQVTVSDGRLTLDQGNAIEMATRINFIHVQGLAAPGNAAPLDPTILEPAFGSDNLNPTDVHMEAIGFFDADNDSHLSTDWEIWTTGAGAERVWFTLGIQGVERLHTHLGDGFFENSHAGRFDLFPSTDYELRVRFRDDAGSVSGYSTRGFATGDASTIFPLELEDVASFPIPTWIDLFGNEVTLPNGNQILASGDPIIAIDLDGNSSYPGNENPPNAIDGTVAKYLNFGELNSGFIVTPGRGASVVTSFQVTTANDAEERDPTTWSLYGTNSDILSTDNSTGNGESWTLVDSGTMNLPSSRNAPGSIETVSNSTAYNSYRMVFTGVKNPAAANSMQIAEIQFFEDSGQGQVPASLRLESPDGELLVSMEGSDQPGNTIINPGPLNDHVAAKLVINAGSFALNLGRSDFSFRDDDGQDHTALLPEVQLSPGEELILWVAIDGSTYYGMPGQTEPDFSVLARQNDNGLNFIATQPNYVVEEVTGDLQLPVNIAMIPDPGPNPEDPLFYVTELYGTIKVVTNDGTTTDFATDLLNFNPTGNFPGSGEQGLAGIVVDPATGDVFVTRVTDTDGLPGGAHHPQVLRFTSNDGGLTAATETVILDMVGESQGQSHQISNISIGPDDMLYVHNGDGFDASTALNLNSYRGKVLRMNLDGSPATDNPFYNAGNGINSRDYIYAYGLRNPFGGAWRASNNKLYEVENGPSVDRFAQVERGGNYGWDGSNASMFINAIYNWDPAHAPVNVTFVQPETFGGSMFPADKMDRAYVSESGPTYAQGPQALGKRIVEFELGPDGQVQSAPTTLVEYIGEGRATVVGLTAGPDGLYFTDLYKDVDAQSPIERGARVLRVRYVAPLPDGDFNDDGNYDCQDIDALIGDIAAGSNSTEFDMNGDGVTNLDDRDLWLAEAGAVNLGAGSSYLVGDANLDGLVDGQDFITWNSNKFTDTGAWCAADWNADGVTDGQDFVAWNANKFQSSDYVFVEPTNQETAHQSVDRVVRTREAAPVKAVVMQPFHPSDGLQSRSMAEIETDHDAESETEEERIALESGIWMRPLQQTFKSRS